MPIQRISLKSVEVKRLLQYNKKPPSELDVAGNIRVMDMKLTEKGKLYVMFDVIYSMKGHKKEIPIMEARLEIDVIYRDKVELLKKSFEKWDKEHEIEPDLFRQTGNNAFVFGVMTLIPLTERMRLPPPVPMPSPIVPKKKKP